MHLPVARSGSAYGNIIIHLTLIAHVSPTRIYFCLTMKQEMAGETTCSWEPVSNFSGILLQMIGYICQYLHFSLRLSDRSSSSKSFFTALRTPLWLPQFEEPPNEAAFLFAIHMVPNKSTGLLLVAILRQSLQALRLVKTSPMYSFICQMVFSTISGILYLKLLVLYHPLALQHPSPAMGLGS